MWRKIFTFVLFTFVLQMVIYSCEPLPPDKKNSLDLLQSQEHPVAKPLSVLCLCSILGLVFVIMHRQEVGYDFAFVRAQDDSKSC